MLTDIWTVMRKELLEILQRTGTRGAGKWGFIMYLGIFGVLLPLSTGAEGVQTGTSAAFLIWLPYMLVLGVVTDTFAGERERHTLETLLSTRLSDQAILYGKMAASLAYGAGITLMCFYAGIIAINVANGFTPFINYPVWVHIVVPLVAILMSVLAAELGVLSSLRAQTARQAAQRLSIGFMVIFLPVYLLPLLPESWLVVISAWLETVNFVAVGVIIGLIVVAVMVFLLMLARRKFRRAEMILD